MSILGRFTNVIRDNNQKVSIWGLNFQITKTMKIITNVYNYVEFIQPSKNMQKK